MGWKFRSTTTNLKLGFNKQTGQVTAKGKAKTTADQKLLDAIQDEDISVRVYTTRNDIETDVLGNKGTVVVGMYGGSEIDNGKVNTTQYLNLDHAKEWRKAGGTNEAQSTLHEVIESYIGAEKNPGKAGDAYFFQQAHREAEKLAPGGPIELRVVDYRANGIRRVLIRGPNTNGWQVFIELKITKKN